MTVSTVRNSITYVGNGSTNTFPYPFKILDKKDLVVMVLNPLKLLKVDVDYDVTEVGNETGGEVKLYKYDAQNNRVPWNLESGLKLWIVRHRESKQLVDISNQGKFYPQVIEDALDHLTMKIQEIENVLSFSAILSALSSITFPRRGVEVFTNSSTFVVPLSTESITYLAIGGGGGGGGASVNGSYYVAAGRGGEAGNISIGWSYVNPGEILTITIGNGGIGGEGYNDGESGGDTIVEGSLSGAICTTQGGAGGEKANQAYPLGQLFTGRKGVVMYSVSTYLSAKGGDGGSGLGQGGAGGSRFTFGSAIATSENGYNGKGFGCGGGGGVVINNMSGTVTAKGGNGTSGLVVIWY